MSTVPQPRPLITSAGRFVRSGAAGIAPRGSAPLQDAALSLQNVAASLRDRLDAIRNDELATPKEKRADVAIAIREAKAAFERVSAKVHNARLAAAGAIDGLQNLLHQYEQKQSPLAVRRLELQADALRRLGVDEQIEAMRGFEQRGDLQGLLAASLVSPDATAATAAFLRVARPESFEQARTDAGASVELHAAALRFARGLNELAADPDAHMVEGARGSDLLEHANRPADTSATPPEWPSWVRP